MLGSDDDSALQGKQVTPYIDPILKHNSVEYGGFLRELGERNMAGYRKVSEYNSRLGIFFVKEIWSASAYFRHTSPQHEVHRAAQPRPSFS